MSKYTTITEEEKAVLSFSAYTGVTAAYVPETYDDSRNDLQGKFFSHAANGLYVSNWAIFVEGKNAYLTFRGTITADDGFVDISTVPARANVRNGLGEEKRVYIHGGCKNVVDNEMDLILEKLYSLHEKNADIIWLSVTGHSLGGGLAQAFTVAYAALDTKPIPLYPKIFTFAAPMVLWTNGVDSQIFETIENSIIYNFCNYADIVPRLFGKGTLAITKVFLHAQVKNQNALLRSIIENILHSIEDTAFSQGQDPLKNFTLPQSYSPLAQYSYILNGNDKLSTDGKIPPQALLSRQEIMKQADEDLSKIDFQNLNSLNNLKVMDCPMKDLTVDDHHGIVYARNLNASNLLTDSIQVWVIIKLQ